ncbi:putative serine protease PepD [Allocatelliglobosispora scoriae]|uniref:Putative serine protease PepD n=1 Tax=Allocatelliglobosispora scoriae TaxID=643052 RepID=A0A841BWD7_9ACTN|nr:trypsin-like peptidase domain-containing protein [Allocatelliglobosispora scoriae]MBB5871816.1 putative serine protease PepD [Allocatelliglobosispora scoriae]
MTEPQNMPEPSTRPQSNEPASTDSGAAWQRPAADAQPAAAVPVTAAQPVPAAEPVTAQQPVYGSQPQPAAGYQAYPAATPLSGGYDGTVPPGTPPAWAMPAAPKPRPFGKILAGVAAAAILSISSGLVGGVVGANFFGDKDVVNTTTVQAAPAIDRTSLASIAAAVQPSVVSIKTEGGEGSGVVMTADGYIVTNNHVVASARGKTVTVVLSDGSKINATIVGTDPRSDLAVVKAESTKLTPAKFADSSAILVGDTVLAIGSPLGLEGSVTEGIISAKDRNITISGTTMTGLLQTDAAINPGNSGGALVNTKGEVVGINSAIATNGGSEGNIGVGFAIPSDKAKAIADQLQKGEKVSHAFLGVKVTTDEKGGAVISELTGGGPAEKAGLKVGDIVTKIDGKPIVDSEALVASIQGHKSGDQIQLTITRDGAPLTATVTLGVTS